MSEGNEYECPTCGEAFDEYQELLDHECDTGSTRYEPEYMDYEPKYL